MANKNIITGIILLVIAIIIIFTVVGNTSNDLVTAGNSVTDANNCSDGTDAAGQTLTYNQTSKFCRNSTGSELYTAGQYDLPLNSLFGASGVLLLVFMAALFIFVLMLVLKKSKS